MTTLLGDLRGSLRLLKKNPGFAATAITVLALAIGANITMFSVVNGLLLRPISPDHPERLVSLYSHDTTKPDSYRPFSYPNYLDIRGAGAAFSDVLAHVPALVGLTEGDVTRRVMADLITANYFQTIGSPLAQGRAFTDQEAEPGHDALVAVISDALFNRMGRPADILHRTVRINQRDYAVVGVAPPKFSGTTAVASPELWLPLSVWAAVSNDFLRERQQPGGLTDRGSALLFLVGRLRPGVTPPAADAVLADLSRRMAKAEPAVNANQLMTAHRVSRTSISTRPPDESGITVAAALLLSVSTIVLVIACLNVANLLLARGLARRREIGVRRALGAGRWDIIRQLLVEGLTMATVAGVIGVFLATRAADLLFSSIRAIAPIPLVFDAAPDGRTIAAAVAWTALSTVLFALGPAWKLTRADIAEDLQLRPSALQLRTGLRRWLAGPNLLVVAQLALSLVLLTTAGLFLRGAARATALDVGFSLDREVLATIDPALGGYDRDRAHQLNLAALERVRALPAVASASLASTVPFGDISEGGGITAKPTTPKHERLSAVSTVVGHDYFRTLGIPILHGREFTEAEERAASGQRIVIIDRTAADRLWPGEDPIGRLLYLSEPRTDTSDALTVVGVAGPSRRDVMDRNFEPHYFIPFGQDPRTMVTLHLRLTPAAVDEATVLPLVRETLRGVDANLPLLKLTTMRTQRDQSASMWIVGISGKLFGTLGLLAAALAVTGLYAVIAYVVSRRVREIGIRMALGATSRDVLTMVLGDGARLTGAGIGLGLGLSAAAAAALRSVAAGIVATDAEIFAMAPALLVSAALAACVVPARRAARLAPLTALREE